MPESGAIEKSELNLQVNVESGEGLDVRQFSVTEGLSTMFRVELVVMSGSAELDFDEIVGHPASFFIHGSAHPRTWRGICSSMQQVGAEEQGLSTYQMSIVPTMWLLTQRRNYKMFQQKSELDIVKEVLGEWGIEPLEKLSGTYKKRKVRVQYAESDQAFVCRMLEDAGISFYFVEQAADGKKPAETKLVLADAPHRAEQRTDSLPFKGDISMVTGEYVTNVRLAQQVRPGRYSMRDHDYRRPPSYKLLASAEAPSGGPAGGIEQKLERYHYTPGAFLFGSTKGDDSPVADDKGMARTDEREAEQVAQKRLEAKRGNAKVIAFETNAMDLKPGVVMKMHGHSRGKLNEDRLLVVAAAYNGTSLGRWSMHIEARSAGVPYRPAVSTPKPRAHGVESATVVGPAGEEIHTDEFGRVRVHFHWDRESKMDDNSSVWIHVSQPWGGAGYGGTALPRIGQEVLVDFLGGDPDRPVIIGRVFTNLQKTPYKLPENKTQSGIKSNSTGGGGGFNEVMFEDAVGKELLRMQAEKDLKKLVKNDENVKIGRNRTKSVGANDSLTVGANRTHRVAHNEIISVGMNQKVSVGVNRSTQIGMIDSTIVGDTHSVMVSPPGEGGSIAEGATSVVCTHKKIVLDTGAGASIVMDGDNIMMLAKDISVWATNSVNVVSVGQITVGGHAGLTLGSPAGDVVIKGGPLVKVNC